MFYIQFAQLILRRKINKDAELVCRKINKNGVFVWIINKDDACMENKQRWIPVCSLGLMSRRDSMMGRRILKNNLNNKLIMVSPSHINKL